MTVTKSPGEYDSAHLLESSPDLSSSATRVARPRRAAPADAVRPTRAEVNLAALRHNLHAVKKFAGGAHVWSVLKADGYGHGAPAVARTLERAGAEGFCVALFEEAVELRDAGIRVPILVMGGYYGASHGDVIARGLVPVVYDLAQVEGFARAVRASGLQAPFGVHLKVDTGMARLGLRHHELSRFADGLAQFPEVRVSGLMTHLACADAVSNAETEEQMLRFDESTALLAKHGVRPEVRHAANSAALMRASAKLDAVRPGIAVFGLSPVPIEEELWQVMRVRTEVVALRTIEVGDTVGYSALWKAQRRTTVATIPMGYADGLSRSLTNRGHVLIRGKRAPIIGAVSMDMSMIDVTDVEGISLRDEAVVLGNQEGPLGKDSITAAQVASESGTIAWEVLTSISRRVPRFYREP